MQSQQFVRQSFDNPRDVLTQTDKLNNDRDCGFCASRPRGRETVNGSCNEATDAVACVGHEEIRDERFGSLSHQLGTACARTYQSRRQNPHFRSISKLPVSGKGRHDNIQSIQQVLLRNKGNFVRVHRLVLERHWQHFAFFRLPLEEIKSRANSVTQLNSNKCAGHIDHKLCGNFSLKHRFTNDVIRLQNVFSFRA